ncbi:hypothetical protein CL65_gp030 [Mycobacterium phage Patience]|uniref:Uncharacterized protein n=1 Tax=Mycobacterium phage Patience TaxID=1074308 RepID=G1JWE0_9CAUD|nr:hypothetical protein CL65_gp030 [Mycobacterium phage Patience]AEL97938.2 hypothetical protein PATIENCE_29 [Mycobacterium phage Patience]
MAHDDLEGVPQMANTPRTSAGTRDVAGEAAPLSPEEQSSILASDVADTTKKAKVSVPKGKRIRAIPTNITRSGDVGTTVEIRAEDFQRKGIEHHTIRFDFRNNSYILPVGDGEGKVSEEAANFLTSNYPTSFEFMGGSE